MTERPVWSKIQDFDEYTDFAFYVPDVNCYGVRLMLSLNRDERTAYLRVTVDNESGDCVAESSDLTIPWTAALALANTTEAQLVTLQD